MECCVNNALLLYIRYSHCCSIPPVVSSTALNPGAVPTAAMRTADTAGTAAAGNKPLFPSATPQVLCCNTIALCAVEH